MGYTTRGYKGAKLEYSRALIDTSIIIDYLRKQNKQKSEFWRLMNEYECAISTITLFELYSGAKNKQQKEDVDTLRAYLEVIAFDDRQAKEASKIFQTLKKQNRLIEFRDIFIASCAITKQIPIATLNIDHFERIEDIQLL